MAPNRWPTAGCFRFADLIRTGALEIGDGYRAKNDELGGDGLIFLRSGHVSDTNISFEGAERFRCNDEARFKGKISRAGDVVVTTKGWSTGRVTFVDRSMPSFVYSPHLSYWRSLDTARISPAFLRQWSRSPECQRQLDSVKMGIDIHPYLSLETQRQLFITLPSASQQEEIASVLSPLDEKLDLNRRMNETLEQFAQTLFKSWFVDFDPVRAKAAGRQPVGMDSSTAALFPDELVLSGLAEIPAGWAVETLGSVASHLQRGVSPSYVEEGGVRVINQKCIRDGRVTLVKTRKHDPTRRAIAGREVFPGDILVNSTGVGTLGRVAQAPAFGIPIVADSHVTIVRANADKILASVLGTGMVCREAEIEALGEGSTGQTELSRSRLSSMLVTVAAMECQQAFDRAITPLRHRQFLNEQESSTLTELRDVLLVKLIDGALGGYQAEKLAEAVL